MGKAVKHFELVANDPAKLRTFFGSLFDWRAEEFPDMGYAMLHAGESEGISGGLGTASAEMPAGLAIYVQVDDVDGYLARARQLGASKVLQEPYDIPGIGRFAIFCDPEGNRIGLWKVSPAEGG
jgi:predicted enzyme related to lactoylglutathione lyase